MHRILRFRRQLCTLCFIAFFAFLGPVAYALPTELFFSEYIEGSSNNKALEIYNGTGGVIDLGAGDYRILMYFNGSASAGLTFALTGSLATGDVFVVAHASAALEILAQSDMTNASNQFNGDDAVVLMKGATVIDVIGQIGFDPGSEWGSGLVSTADNTLRRKADIYAGDADGSDTFDPSAEWEGFATNTYNGLGYHEFVAAVPEPMTFMLLILGLSALGLRQKSVKYFEQ